MNQPKNIDEVRGDPFSHQLTALQRLATSILNTTSSAPADIPTAAGIRPAPAPVNDEKTPMEGVVQGPSTALVLYQPAATKRRRDEADVGNATNDARAAREFIAEVDAEAAHNAKLRRKRRRAQQGGRAGKQPGKSGRVTRLTSTHSCDQSDIGVKRHVQAPSRASNFLDEDDYSSDTERNLGGHGAGDSAGQNKRSRMTRVVSDSDNDDDSSDTETIATLYDNKNPPKDQTIIQILTLLESLVKKVDHIVNNPATPATVRRTVHPVVAEQLGASTQPTRAAASRGNFHPWSQDVEDIRPAGARTREPARTAILGYIRICLMKALKRTSSKSPLPPGPPADVAVPTLEHFYIKWNESHHSEFNSASCQLITNQVLKDWPALISHHNWDDVYKMVSAHVKYLIVTFRRQNLPVTDTSELERHRRSSANRRMHTTFDCRMHVIEAIPTLKKHRRLLMDLGIDGTSSDEEDSDKAGTYNVKRIKQLSSSVRELKRKLDDAYQVLEKKPGCKGGRSRKRVRTSESSTRKFRVKGLPINCVNSVWYNRLTEAQKAYYKLSDYEYDFTFPDEILNM